MTSVKKAVLFILKAWQKTRIFRPAQCRFYPSCSQYLHDAIVKHGLAAGSVLGTVRLCKCHPLHDGGVDEVPETINWFSSATPLQTRQGRAVLQGDTTN